MKMHSMSYIMANAVRNALSCKAYMPERVLSTALRLVPDLDNVALHMIGRYIRTDSCEFDCLYSRRACEPMLDNLAEAVQAELERRKAISCSD